jgi:hypothetical protein
VADDRGSPELGLAGAPVYGSSPRLHGKDDELARVQSGASPEVEGRRGGRATAVQNRRQRRSVEAMLERGEKRGWERCGEVRGWCSPFIGVERAPGRGGRGLTPALMALTPLKIGGLRGELRGENEGGVVTARRHPRRGVAGKRWRRERAQVAGGEGRS